MKDTPLEAALFVLAVIAVCALAVFTFWVIIAAILASNPPRPPRDPRKLADLEESAARIADFKGNPEAAAIHRRNAESLRRETL